MADHEKPEREDSWPGILDEIEIKVVPVEYISVVEVNFTNGGLWEIDIEQDDEQDSEEAAQALEESLETLFQEYEDEISSVNFVLDIEKVKKDITDRTRRFMKKKK